MTQYVLLCRHDQHRDGKLKPRRLTDGSTEHAVDAVGARLREQLALTAPPGRTSMTLASARCAHTKESHATLDRLLTSIGWTLAEDGRTAGSDVHPFEIPVDCPEELKPGQNLALDAVDAFADGILKPSTDLPSANGNTVLIVGHQPFMSRFADNLLRPAKRWNPRVAPVPLERADIVCIGFEPDRGARWLVWAISYDDDDAAKKVREKIGAKMESAKLLGGLLTIGLSILFGVLFDRAQFELLGDRGWAVQLGAACFLLAAVLYLATMYAYDTLLMPQRFWGDARTSRSERGRRKRWLVERPPSSAAWVLYQNMMRIWRYRFTVASGLMVAGAGFLGYAALEINTWVVVGAAIPVVLLLILWLRWSRPVLGSED